LEELAFVNWKASFGEEVERFFFILALVYGGASFVGTCPRTRFSRLPILMDRTIIDVLRVSAEDNL